MTILDIQAGKGFESTIQINDGSECLMGYFFIFLWY